MSAFRPFFRFLDTVGNGTGTKNAIGDYSSTQTDFKILNPVGADGDMEVNRLIVQIEDFGNAVAETYGVLGVLTNGVEILVFDGDGNTVIDVTDGQPIKNNGQWARHSYDVSIANFPGTNDFVECRWTFGRAGSPIELKPGWSFCARLNDDLQGLIAHYFQVQGFQK